MTNLLLRLFVCLICFVFLCAQFIALHKIVVFNKWFTAQTLVTRWFSVGRGEGCYDTRRYDQLFFFFGFFIHNMILSSFFFFFKQIKLQTNSNQMVIYL